MNSRGIELVKNFRHTVPYINMHYGKIFVIMLNGEAIEHDNFLNIINDVGLLHNLGIRLVVVYGARPQINNKLQLHKIESKYHKNIRITDCQTLTLIKQIVGSLQLDITARLSMSIHNTPLQGAHINVVSGNFITAQPIGIDQGIDYCKSGRIRRINEELIYHHLDNNTIVLIGPVAGSITGECFNLNTEEIATQLAIKLQAEKMIGFSPEQGVIHPNGHIVSELFPDDIQNYLDAGNNTKNPICVTAFLRGAAQACRNGVRRNHLISYKENGALFQELFSREGIGTQVAIEFSEKIRRATIDDIGGILQLIRPLEKQDILIRRSREQLEIEIDKFTIIIFDNLIIACAALYPFPKEQIGELACVAVHPDYRNSSRGEILLKRILLQANQMGLKKLFVLTTNSIHWFQERGFKPVDVSSLPESKRKIYNYQRRSQILMVDLF